MISEAAQTVLFYTLGIMTVVLAVMVVCARRLLRAAVALMSMLTLSACFYVMLQAEFLAGVQVLVYIGGIVVLIVFAIMLTRSVDLLEDVPPPLRQMMGLGVTILFGVVTCFALLTSEFKTAPETQPTVDNTMSIGKALLDYGPNGYVIPFEVISLLLLAAAIGGIVIARRIPPNDQPFTSGGDLPHEVVHATALTQRDATPLE